MVTPRITTLEDAYATGNWNNLFIGVWRGPVTISGARAWGMEHERMAAAFPGGFASFVIVEKQVPIPDHPLRRAIACGMDQAGTSIRGMAGVQEAKGFAGALFRSLQLALSTLASTQYPRKGFASIPEAAEWIAPYLGPAPNLVSSQKVVEAAAMFQQMISAPGASAELQGPRSRRFRT